MWRRRAVRWSSRAIILFLLFSVTGLFMPMSHAVWRAVLTVSATVSLLPPGPSGEEDPCQNLTGAVWTTDAQGQRRNDNFFLWPDEVYLRGGPENGSAGLPDGHYFYRVTTPDGDPLSEPRGVEVVGGVFLVQLAPFAESRFGVYKAWLSPRDDFPPYCSKTDVFRVSRNIERADPRAGESSDASSALSGGKGAGQDPISRPEPQEGPTGSPDEPLDFWQVFPDMALPTDDEGGDVEGAPRSSKIWVMPGAPMSE